MRFAAATLLITILTLAVRTASDEKRNISRRGSSQPTEGRTSTVVNVNEVAMWVHADGQSGFTPEEGPGVLFPRGNTPATYTVRKDGFIWAGKVHDGEIPIIRSGGQMTRPGSRPGSIGNQGRPESSDRIWRIRRDYATADLTLDATEIGATPDSVLMQYRADWRDWPASKGAPFYDADNDGIYTPQFHADGSPVLFPEADEPGLARADQVVWFTANDLVDGIATKLAGSRPIGIEMQATFWAYNLDPALSHVVFKRYRLIYKGMPESPESSRIDSMYVAQWSDLDIGGRQNDFAGCDTIINIGYAYNATFNDAVFMDHGLPPPAAGYALVQGPICDSPGDVAKFDFRKVENSCSLNMTTFMFYTLDGTGTESLCRGYNCTLTLWNIMRGYRPRPESPPQPWLDPDGQATTFRVPGDPVTGTGWLDTNPGDRRIYWATGPFTMSLGDTQEVIIALVAGLGSDRLASVQVMKFFARKAQEFADNGFVLPPREPQTEEPPIPRGFALHQNFPNPFNPATEIRFELPVPQRVRLTVYDIRGRHVRTLVDRPYEAGVHAIGWDGKDTRGQPLPSGIYVYRIDAGIFRQSRKMALVR